jgi:hypothetical protein
MVLIFDLTVLTREILVNEPNHVSRRAIVAHLPLKISSHLLQVLLPILLVQVGLVLHIGLLKFYSSFGVKYRALIESS